MRGKKEMQGIIAPENQGTFTPNLIQEQDFNQSSFSEFFKQNEKQKKKSKIFQEKVKLKRNFYLSEQTGITLIALVITVIIMIILAGVSINAIVGDNGIITQAQNATVQNSIANLEEYLKELYVENYDTIANSSYESKVEALAGISAYKYYFYNPSRDSSVGALSYISTSDGYVLYLINKSKLPEEIQDLLIGGDAGDGEYADYATLNDVYGVTKDLKVYYCSGGVDTITGIASTELDTDNLSRVVFSSLSDSKVYNLSWYNLLSSYDTNGDGELTVQELRSVKTLTISSSAGITSLSELYNLTSLGELTLDSLKIDNIDGIENALSLYYVYFKSCEIADYTALCDVSNLEYLYFYDIDDEELETACTDIATAEFSKLTYLAVVGNNSYICDATLQDSYKIYVSSDKSTNLITTLAPLDILSDTTKSAVKYLSIQNNDIEVDLSYISDYTNLILLRCEYNSLSSLDGLDDMDNLTYLFANDNELGDGTTDGTDKSISALSDKSSLYQVYMVNNADLAYVDAFENDTAIRYLYLAGCSSDMIITIIANAGIIDNCIDYSLPVMYLSGTVFKLSDYFTASEFTDSQLIQYLKDNETITCLNLEYATRLTNDTLNEVLETMTQLQYVTLRGCTGLTTIGFVHELKEDEDGNETGVTGLIELDLRDTNAIDLTNLNDYATNLLTLRISNENIDMTTIQSCINRLTNNSDTYWYGNNGNSGLVCTEFSLIKQLENCTDLSCLRSNSFSAVLFSSSSYSLDLSNCTKLTTVVYYGWFFSVKLPSSISYFIGYQNFPPIFAEGTGLVSKITIGSTYSTYCSGDNFLEGMSSIANCQEVTYLELYEQVAGFTDFSFFSAGSNVCSFKYWKGAASSSAESLTSFNGISNLATGLTTLSVYQLNKISDFSDISNLYNLNTIDLHSLGLTDLSFISNLSQITELTLNDNSIAGLKSLKNLTNLKYLNLKNNAIYDTALDDDGNTYNNLQILIDLYNNGSLRTLYISGNKIIEDGTTNSYYKTLLGLTWTAKDF